MGTTAATRETVSPWAADPPRPEARAGFRMADLETARAAKVRLRSQLAGRDGVGAIGIARSADGYGLQVNLTGASARASVPGSVDGVAVRVRVTGPVRPQH